MAVEVQFQNQVEAQPVVATVVTQHPDRRSDASENYSAKAVPCQYVSVKDLFSANHLAQAWLRAPSLSTMVTTFDLRFQYLWPAVSLGYTATFHVFAATLWCHELLGTVTGTKLVVFTLALQGVVVGTLLVYLWIVPRAEAAQAIGRDKA